jgi:hypothetical protein
MNTGNELTSLFEPLAPTPGRSFPAFAISMTLHGAMIGAVSWVLIHSPSVIPAPLGPHYTVRQLDFHAPETAASRAAEALYPTQDPPSKTQVRPQAQAGEKQALKASADRSLERTAQAEPRPRAVPALRLPEGGQGKQTLVQPQIHTHEVLTQTMPIPSALIWKPEVKPVLHIVPPAPDQVTTADVQTSLEVPNEEVELADLSITASKNPPKVPTPPAGSTSPVAVPRPAEVKKAPSTVSTSNQQPTPAAVLSLSDLRMNEGTAALPPVNESKGDDHKEGAALPGGTTDQRAVQPGRVIEAGGSGSNGSGASPGNSTIADAQKAAGDDSASGDSAQRIQLPRNGRFGVVVVGTSLSDQYPETLQIWSDRVAYTAYLHVGTPKAWILQYAQLRTTDAASGGGVARLDAPWPYDILRPNLLTRDLNGDALMIHGILNEAGRLEKLAIAFPQDYVHGSFVLRELAQWQFRPAQQLGKPTAVEVLLIIPEDND